MRITRILLCACLGTALFAGADFWEQKPFAEWSQEEVVHLLVDSPWGKTDSEMMDFREAEEAGPVTWKDLGIEGRGGNTPAIKDGSPVGGIGAPKSKNKIVADINVRWSSALPVRQAAALTKFGKDDLKLPEARRLLEQQSEFYVLEISGVPPAIAARGTESLEANLYRNAFLRTASGRTFTPDSVYVTARGASLDISIRYAKTNPITLADKQLVFKAEYGLLKIERRFKLKDMVYQGRLELVDSFPIPCCRSATWSKPSACNAGSRAGGSSPIHGTPETAERPPPVVLGTMTTRPPFHWVT